MGVPDAAVIASGDPATRAAVRSAVLERFTRLIAGADSATRTLAARRRRPCPYGRNDKRLQVAKGRRAKPA
jgi:hypothetical protein